jgi:uncharacterized protein YybS (DUF2232 family)
MAARGIRTQGLTEGAILAALVALFAVATRYLPLVGIATALLCPLPLTVLVIRHGFKVAIIAAVAATLVGAMLAGPLVGLAILVSFGPMGLVLGIGARQGWPAVRTVLLGALVSFVSTILNYLGLLGGGRISLGEMAKTMERSVEMSAGIYARLGMSQAQIDATSAQLREVARLFPYLLPAILVFGALFAAWLNYEVGRRVLDRFGYRWQPLPPIRTWRVPALVIWFVPLSFLLASFGNQKGAHPLIHSAGMSLALTVQMVFAVQGILAGWVILGNYGFGRFAQVTAVAMVFMVPPLGLLVFTLGVLDSALRIRDRWGLPRAAVDGAGR